MKRLLKIIFLMWTGFVLIGIGFIAFPFYLVRMQEVGAGIAPQAFGVAVLANLIIWAAYCMYKAVSIQKQNK